ncbi:MAG: antitoxin [Oscillospiraceae bacterium]|nr:antitoxin [Oscillospiraceae bacterium]
MLVSIELTHEERKLAEKYALAHSMSVEDAFKKALFGCIEDETDAAIAVNAYMEYLQDGKRSAPIEELWEELYLK